MCSNFANIYLPVDLNVTCCRRSGILSGMAAVLKTPRAAEMMTETPPGCSDAAGSLQVCWNYPESSGPLGEFCRIKLFLMFLCSKNNFQVIFQFFMEVEFGRNYFSLVKVHQVCYFPRT